MDYLEYKAAFDEHQSDLRHFGILGMKWGVRRYQNPDGTLTAAGRKRYDRLKDKDPKRASKYGTPEKDAYIKKRNSFKTDEEKDAWEREYAEKQVKEETTKKETNELMKQGWESNRNGIVHKKEKNISYVLRSDRDSGSFKNSKESYDSFKKDKKMHMETIKKQFLQEANNKHSDGWGAYNSRKLKNQLDKEDCSIQFDSINGQEMVLITMAAGESLGYHALSGEYDTKKKKLYHIGLEG